MERVTLDAQTAMPVAAQTGSRTAVTASIQPADTSEVRDVVRDSVARRSPLRLIGRGTWLTAGRPVADDARPLALDGLSGIVEYTPGDLTLTARAGTSLADIAVVTAAEGQWLPLAPWGGDAGSLGATVATASAGPMSGAVGTPRDIVLGLEAVTGIGDVVRGGGRVVKNVAGFDLTRLMVGAWGTLGVLTEVSVRLRALPEHDLTVVVTLPDAVPLVADLLTRLRAAAVAPVALELVTRTLAHRLGVGAEAALLVRVAGNAEVVTAQRDTLAQLASIADAPANIWSMLRTAEPADASVLRTSGSVAGFAETWAAADRMASMVDGGFAHASVLRSVARVVLPNESGALAPDVVAALRDDAGASRIFERLPAALWPVLAPTAVGDRLSHRVRDAFDPQRVLNPGVLGEVTT